MKTCQNCKEEFPEESFGVNNRYADGRHIYCKACCREKTENRVCAEAETEYQNSGPRWEWKPEPKRIELVDPFQRERNYL